MSKDELITHVAATTDLPKSQAEMVVNLFWQCIMDALAAGENVELRGFGSFRLRHRQARSGRNPQTGESVPVPAKTVPWFTAGMLCQISLLSTPSICQLI